MTKLSADPFLPHFGRAWIECGPHFATLFSLPLRASSSFLASIRRKGYEEQCTRSIHGLYVYTRIESIVHQLWADYQPFLEFSAILFGRPQLFLLPPFPSHPSAVFVTGVYAIVI